MATEEARIPLLAGQDSLTEDPEELKDDFNVNYRLVDPGGGLYDSSFRPENHDTVLLGEEVGSGGGALRRTGSERNAMPGPKRQQQYSGSEMIVAIFVVAFDTKKGEQL